MPRFSTIRTLLLFLPVILAVVESQEDGDEALNGHCEWSENNTDGDCIDPVWKEGSLPLISDALGCEWGTTRSYTKDDWATFNRIYNEVVGLDQSSIPPEYELNGFQIPIEVIYSEDVGRGIFTKVPISKGDLIYISTNNASFSTKEQYLTFLRMLPKDFACDVLIWAFSRMVSAEDDDEEIKYMVCVDLDEGSFINSAHWNTRACNMELGTEKGLLEKHEDERVTWYGCDLRFYANRDIEANEEIRADYGDFAEPHGWYEIGLIAMEG